MMSREDGKTLLGEFVISGLYIRPDVYAAILRAMDEL
jgi:hypothetical protein